jgi:hypothetical protein
MRAIAAAALLAALPATAAEGPSMGRTSAALVACTTPLPFVKARAMGLAPETVAILAECAPFAGQEVQLRALRVQGDDWQVWLAGWRGTSQYVLIRPAIPTARPSPPSRPLPEPLA